MRAARRSWGRGSGLKACGASSAMPFLCALLRSRLQPSLLGSLTLTSAQSLSCGGSRGVRTWSARTGPGACAGEGGLGRERALVGEAGAGALARMGGIGSGSAPVGSLGLN